VNILVYGAGVLGSFYAARLKESGQNVSVLARGNRLVELQKFGIIQENSNTGKSKTTYIKVTDSLGPDDVYDLIIVLVRKNQLIDILPSLAANRCTPNVLFMVNNAAGPHEIIAALGRERVLLGFAGAGGTREGQIIRGTILPGYLQPTCVGELDGQSTLRVRQIAEILKSAGFPTVIRKNMDAWLKTHAALVSPVANAIYMSGGSIYRLAHTKENVKIMVHAIREGFKVLHSLDIPITPTTMRIFELIPEPLMVSLLQQILDTRYAELIIARHANAARDEMKQLAEEFRLLARTSSSTIAIDHLRSYI